MHPDPLHNVDPADRIEVILDGVPIGLPADRRSLEGIRCHLETIALRQQRFLGSIRVAGHPAAAATSTRTTRRDFQIQAFTMALGDRHVLILMNALQQTNQLLKRVQNAITNVLINECTVARQLWWNLANELREPILTLSLLPDNVCGPMYGQVTFTQLRKWQLEQLATIIRDVDQAASKNDVSSLSDALAAHVAPWLQSQCEVIQLWLDTTRPQPGGKDLPFSSAT